jgi:hypothetical protein
MHGRDPRHSNLSKIQTFANFCTSNVVAAASLMIALIVRAHRPHSALQPRRL